MTDLLGVMTAWSPPTLSVQPESGPAVQIALADVVSGKPVPPRPSVRLRVGVEEAERRALAGWPAVVSEPLGSWVLRASGGYTSRANSVLAVGSPAVPLTAALARVEAFYDAQALPLLAQVVVGSDVDPALTSAGWVPARPGEADSCFQIASVAQVARALRGSGSSAVALSATASEAWLAPDARAQVAPAAARAVLEGPAAVAFASVTDPVDGLVARGRVSCADDYAGITDVWVCPARRRSGLAREVLASLVGWAAEHGARTAYLQTRGDNPAALALYDRLGFVTHHEYRYLTPG